MKDPMPGPDPDGAAPHAARDDVGGDGDRASDRDAVRRLIASALPENSMGRPVEQRPDAHAALGPLVDTVLSDPARVAALDRTGLLADPSRLELDRFAALAAEALGTRYAAVSLVDVDEQVLVGCNDQGEGSGRRRPLDQSICKYAVASGEPLIVDDTSEHPLLADSPVVQDGSVGSYAGFPVTDQRGHTVGTLCAWDSTPRHWTGSQIQILEDLTAVVRAKIFAG